MTYDSIEQQEKVISSNDKKSILIVDDHPIVRAGLTYFINQQENLYVCGEAEDAHKALAAIEELMPDMAIVDISLQGQSGIELIKNIKIRYSKFPILVLSIHDETVYAEISLRAGAMGYIMKHEANDKLLNAIQKVLNNEIYIADRIASKILHKFINNHDITGSSPIEILSDRELEVFRLIGQGYATNQIANELCLGIKTIETYRNHIKTKLKLKSSPELIQYAIKWVQSEMFF